MKRSFAVRQRLPVSVLVVCRDGLCPEHLGALRVDRRVEPTIVRGLAAEWLGFANRVPVVVMNLNDPWSALGYALTAGITSPIFVACEARSLQNAAEILAAGAAGQLRVPIARRAIESILNAARECCATPVVEPRLRLLLDPVTRIAHHGTRRIALTQREFALLHFLSARAGPIALADLYRLVWGRDPNPRADKLIAVHMLQLRRKLGQIGLANSLATLRGFGYALRDDGSSQPAWRKRRDTQH